MFQSTRPRGARPESAMAYTPHLCFNPRAREGRDHHLGCLFYANLSFNPRAREGRDLGIPPGGKTCYVSIHAPARGATYV